MYNALLHSNGHGFHSMCWRQLASYQKVQVFTPLRDAIFVFRCMRCQHADRHKNLASQFFVPCRTSVGVAKVAYSPPFCHEKIGTVFSERELTFTFAICYRPSVCLSVCPSVVCLSSVTFVRPTQAVQIFGNISTALGTLAIH